MHLLWPGLCNGAVICTLHGFGQLDCYVYVGKWKEPCAIGRMHFQVQCTEWTVLTVSRTDTTLVKERVSFPIWSFVGMVLYSNLNEG